ncbi:aminoglycoside phosphotransferase family protein [Clostridium sp. AN503]|uniref:phosphotransferase family protein n=1 Tax=Clostridium sp. AN503 TaxID=3160598 RepID=UPI003459219D
MARELISKNATKSVYRDGDKAIKVFCKGFPKAEVLNEAVISARIEEIGGINIPATLAVEVDEDGCWAITKEFISGKTLKQLMDENPDKLDEYLNQMVDLQLTIHSKTCPLLNKLKDKMARQISEIEELNPVNRYDLLTRLDSTPKHTKLCHGDFQPSNIIVKEDGTMFVLDWVHATQGNASADVARTYLLFCLEDQATADKYMDLFCKKTGTDKRYVQQWLPLVAAAQLTKKRPEEADLLQRWLNVCDYQ